MAVKLLWQLPSWQSRASQHDWPLWDQMESEISLGGLYCKSFPPRTSRPKKSGQLCLQPVPWTARPLSWYQSTCLVQSVRFLGLCLLVLIQDILFFFFVGLSPGSVQAQGGRRLNLLPCFFLRLLSLRVCCKWWNLELRINIFSIPAHLLLPSWYLY